MVFLIETVQTNDNSEIIIFGRDSNNKKYMKIEKSFMPYFYIPESCQVPEDYRITSIQMGFKGLTGDSNNPTEPVKKITVNKSSEVINVRQLFPKTYEADIPFTQRYLIDVIGETPTYPLRTLYLDIETDDYGGFPDTETADKTVISTSFFDSFTKKSYKLLYKPKECTKKIDNDIKVFNTETDLLLAIIGMIKNVDPDIISGWNCLDKDTHIHTKDGLKSLKNINIGETLANNVKVINKWHSHKKVVEFGSGFGIIRTSAEHKFLVVDSPKKYKNIEILKRTQGIFQQVKDIKNGFLKLPYDTNTNTDINIDDNMLYMLGMIYTDGSIQKHNVSIYNNNINIIRKIKNIRDILWNESSIISKDDRHKNSTYRLKLKRKNIENYLNIIFSNDKKCLDIEFLSKLSSRQFGVFCSGLIDGDGSVNIISIKRDSTYNERNGFHNLLLKNGILATTSKIKNEYKTLFRILSIENHTLLTTLKQHVINTYKIQNINASTKLNRSTNKPKYFIDRDNKIIYSYITENRELNEYTDMIDIETSDHTFLTPFVTHNCAAFDMTYLIRRMERLGIDYKEMSPLRHVRIDKKYGDVIIKGRIILDMMAAYKHYRRITNQGQAENYSLQFTGENVLGSGKIQHKETFREMWLEKPNKLLEYNLRDTEMVYEINEKFQIIDFFQSICSKSCASLRNIYHTSTLVDGLLLRKVSGKLALPSKVKHEADGYSGAHVFKPVPGLYKNVLALDIKGMYPNIIKTFNIGYETFNPDGNIQISEGIGFDSGVGIISQTIRDLGEERTTYKKLMKQANDDDNTELRQFYNFRQYAVKVLGNCFSHDTKILTPNGEVNIKDLKIGDYVYSIEPNTKRLQTKKVIRTYEHDYNGDMCHFKTQNMDLMVTPNHNMLATTPYESRGFFVNAEHWKTSYTIPKHTPKTQVLPKYISLLENVNIEDYTFYIKKNIDMRTLKSKIMKIFPHSTYKFRKINKEMCEVICSKQDLYRLFLNRFDVYVKYKKYNNSDKFKPFIHVDDFSTLLGWFISEGSLYKSTKKRYDNGNCRGESKIIHISQSEKHNPNYYNEIEQLLIKLNISFYKHKKGFSFSSPLWYDNLIKCGKNSYEKNVHSSFFEHIDYELFFKSLYKGDGHKKLNKYTTVSETLKNQLLIILTELGYRVRWTKDHHFFRIIFDNYRWKPHKNNITKLKNNSDKVYCVEVEDNHTLLAGRNNKYCWCGQSIYGYLGFPGSRLYKPEVADAVTTIGRELINWTAKFLEDNGYTIVYGDTDSCVYDTKINIIYDNKESTIKIGELFENSLSDGEVMKRDENNYIVTPNSTLSTPSIDITTGKIENNKIKYIMGHKVNKKLYKIKTKDREVTITEDHSIMVKRDDNIIEIKPTEIQKTDKILIKKRKI